MPGIFTKSTVKLSLILSILLLALHAPAQINITGSQTPAALVQTLVGTGVITSNATLTCPSQANGIFKRTGLSNLGLDSGVILTSGVAATTTYVTGANGAASLFAAT